MYAPPPQPGIELDLDKIAAFCRRHPIRRLSLFGSVLTERFDESSDVDFLVEFAPGAKVSLWDVGGMMQDLTEVIGRQADLRTADDLSRYFRAEVIRTAEPVYEA